MATLQGGELPAQSRGPAAAAQAPQPLCFPQAARAFKALTLKDGDAPCQPVKRPNPTLLPTGVLPTFGQRPVSQSQASLRRPSATPLLSKAAPPTRHAEKTLHPDLHEPGGDVLAQGALALVHGGAG